MYNLRFLFFLLLPALLQPTFAQPKGGKTKTEVTKGVLEGLRKAGPGDLDASEPIMLDGVSIPVYSEQLEKLAPDQLMQVMMGGEYMPEPYIDSKKKIRVFVLRKTTEEERNMLRRLSAQGEDGPGEADPSIGKEAAAFSVVDLEGQNYSSNKLKGRVVVLNFWFVECKPCIMEMPELNKLVEKYNNQDVTFLGFARNKEDQIRKFLTKTPFSYRIIPSSTQVAEAFGIIAFPTHILIDQEGKVQFKAVGLGPTTMSDLDEAIGKLIQVGGN